MPVQTDAKVILLKDTGGLYYVCEEYTIGDNGRCQVLDTPPFYAAFHRDDMSLEYRKVAISIAEIIYEDLRWPTGVAGTRESVLGYFGF